jgi:hypothetical protein
MCGGPTSVTANVPNRERIDVSVVCPGVYAHARTEIRRRADLGDPRLMLFPDTSAAKRRRINDASPNVRLLRELADAMDRGETVTVSWSYGRAFREITSMPWAPHYEGLVISADDAVRPAGSIHSSSIPRL